MRNENIEERLAVLFLTLLGSVSVLLAASNLEIVFKDGQPVAKSQEFLYEKGTLCFAIPTKPDWVEFVEFCPGSFEKKIQSGSSVMRWSSSVAQHCAFKVKIDYGKIGDGAPWSFHVKDENGMDAYEVKVVPPFGVAPVVKQKQDVGIAICSDEGDLLFSFKRCGGAQKSPFVQYQKGEWVIDTAKQPDWVERVKIVSPVLGEKTLLGANKSGGKSVNSFSVNGTMEFAFVVVVKENKDGKRREWSLPVRDAKDAVLFYVGISQL